MLNVVEGIDKIYEFIRFKLLLNKLTKRYNKDNFCTTAQTCHEFLIRSSRSFVIVILSLNQELSHAVCVYYLVLRALDTIEDDFTIEKNVKIPMLEKFYQNLYDTDWSFDKSSDKDKIVLEKFSNISTEFIKFPKVIQDVIQDICRQMGKGMAEFQLKDVISLLDWDKYCYYVAGLVGIGLTKLFVFVANEDESLMKEETIAISMGLFLQKTNIIRDIKEDIIDERFFWPLEIVHLYLGDKCSNMDLIESSHISLSVSCANDLIYHTLKLIPDCLAYMSQLKNPAIFRFCAIPQAMALATLVLCFDNPDIFKKHVKIPKYETAKIFNNCHTFTKTKLLYHFYALKLRNKILATDHTKYAVDKLPQILEMRTRTMFLLDKILTLTHTDYYPKLNGINQPKSAVLRSDTKSGFESNNHNNIDLVKILSNIPDIPRSIEAPYFWLPSYLAQNVLKWVTNSVTLLLITYLFYVIYRYIYLSNS